MKEKYKLIIALGIFIIAAILFTYPLIFHFFTHQYAVSGDAQATLWEFWQAKLLLLKFKTLLSSPNPLLGAPYGTNLVNFDLNIFLALPFTFLVNEVFAYNFWIFLSFVLAGFGMYLLVYYLTKNFFASLLAGLIFTFSPYHAVRASGHFSLAQIEWLPILIYLLFLYKDKKQFKYLLGIFFLSILIFLINPYYGIFLPFLFLLFLLFFLNYQKLKWPKIIIAFLVLIALGIFYWQVVLPKFGTVKRPIEEFYLYSLKPHDYLLPSVNNPYFRNKSLKIINADLGARGNPTEKTAYLGFIPLGLSLVGIIAFRRKKEIWFFILLGFFAFLTSLGPTVEFLNFQNIPTPAFLFYKFVPFARSLNRYSLFVQMSISVLAGFGFAYFSRFFKKNFKFFLPAVALAKAGYVILLFAICFLIFSIEYYDGFNKKDLLINVSQPAPVYLWLKNEPGDFIVLEYPTRNLAINPYTEHLFNQRFHQKRLFNSHYDRPNAPKDEQKWYLENLTEPGTLKSIDTTNFLKKAGVKYILVHPEMSYSEMTQNPKIMEGIEKNENLAKIKEFNGQGADFVLVYQIL